MEGFSSYSRPSSFPVLLTLPDYACAVLVELILLNGFVGHLGTLQAVLSPFLIRYRAKRNMGKPGLVACGLRCCCVLSINGLLGLPFADDAFQLGAERQQLGVFPGSGKRCGGYCCCCAGRD